MAIQPPHPPESRDGTPGAFLSLISLSLLELRQDVARLFDRGWAEPVRRRAHVLAVALSDACGREGLEELATLIRSLANLTRLPKEEAGSLGPALREKLEELLDRAQRLTATYSKRRIG